MLPMPVTKRGTRKWQPGLRDSILEMEMVSKRWRNRTWVIIAYDIGLEIEMKEITTEIKMLIWEETASKKIMHQRDNLQHENERRWEVLSERSQRRVINGNASRKEDNDLWNPISNPALLFLNRIWTSRNRNCQRRTYALWRFQLIKYSLFINHLLTL